jgi:hypothetical protein
MRRFGVRIGTNLGPVTVTCFSHEPEFTRSRLWLHDGERAKLDNDGRFAGFVDDLGPMLLRRLGVEPLPPGMYMEIDQDIDAGRSWQLGTLVAMLLASAGRFAGGDERGVGVLFCTGEVAHSSGAIRPVELVAEKLEASRAALPAQPEDCRWLVPKANAADAARVALPPGVTLVALERVDELLAILGLEALPPPAAAPAPAAAPDPPPAPAAPDRQRHPAWLVPVLALPLLAALALGALLAAPMLLDRLAPAASDGRAGEPEPTAPTQAALPQPNDPPPAADPPEPAGPPELPAAATAPEAPSLMLELGKRRPQPGQSCLVQNFDHGLVPLVEASSVPPTAEWLPTLAGDRQLCGVDVRIVPGGRGPLFVLGRAVLEPADGAVLERVGTLDGLSPLSTAAGITLRLKPDRAVAYHLDLVAGATPVPPDALDHLDDLTTRASLEAAGFTIRRLIQRLEHTR